MRADAGNLLRRFSRAVDHLARALANRAMVIDHRIAEILKRLRFQMFKRVVDADFAALYARKDFSRIHSAAPYLDFKSSKTAGNSSFNAFRMASRCSIARAICASGS